MRASWAPIVSAREIERGAFIALVDGWARDVLDRGLDDWGYDAESESCVYVVQDMRSGAVKVGTTGALYPRLEAIRTRVETPDWPPLPRSLALVAHTPGSRYLESSLLRLVAPLLVSPRSEWLRAGPESAALVQQLGGATLLPARESIGVHP